MNAVTEPKLTRNELIAEISRATELPLAQGHVILDAILAGIARALKSGDKVEIRGFGTFGTRQRRPRNGRNPKTGAPVNVPATTVARFKPSKEVLALLNRPADGEPSKTVQNPR